MRNPRFTLVDVFAERPLEGNQLAVFTDARTIPDALLQPIAREMNFSETVFLFPPREGGHARIRIFTPRKELPFAGHPVLGTAFVLGAGVALDELKLETGSGIVSIHLEREGGQPIFGRMVQPIPILAPFELQTALLEALGVSAATLPIECYDNGIRHVYVALETESAVAKLEPDLTKLARLPFGVSCFATEGTRVKTRMFAPALGVAEDPATGSAAGPLACHLARHGRIRFGEEIVITQGVEVGRPSLLHAKVLGARERIERVEVGGRAFVVGRGELGVLPAHRMTN